MRKILSSFTVLILILNLAGCAAVGDKSASASVIYGIAAVISVLLLVGYLCVDRKHDPWFVLLFSSVLVVNVGYFWLSISSSLGEALLANKLSYLGSVFLPMSMYLIIRNAARDHFKKHLPVILCSLSVAVLCITLTSGYLGIYYREVSFEIVNGVSTLVKVYGPLHVLYLVYLIGYLVAMVTTIIRAAVKKTIDNLSHGIILFVAAFVNICVWFFEQISDIGFEMLSISYIISESFLLGLHLIMKENQRLKELVNSREEPVNHKEVPSDIELNDDEGSFESQKIQFLNGFDTLTPKERALFDLYIDGVQTKDILEKLNIKENTLKFHSKNLYAKLGVSSRKQLTVIYRRINDQRSD